MINNNHSFGIALAAGVLALAGTAAMAQTPSMTQNFTLSADNRTPYDAATGHGYVSTPGGNEIAFSVRLSPGDYRVTASLDAGRTTLWAEDRRLMAPPQDVPAGQTREVSFIVNVRSPYLNPAEQDAVAAPKVGLRGDEPAGRTWDDQLTIAASGPAKALRGLTIAPVTVRRLLLAGDSTVTDQAGADFASWGQMLPRFLAGDISVANHARGGETMKSFLTSLRWDKLLSEVRPGDIVVIQFGHNDEKKQWPRTYAAADQGYPAYLRAFVADLRQRQAVPVLVTPVARRFFEGNRIVNTHAGYDAAVKAVAADLGLPVIDLTTQTADFYESLGPERSKLAFANGGADKTHHNAYGAWVIACWVAQDLNRLGLGLEVTADLPTCAPEPAAFEITAADWPLMRAPKQPQQTAEPPPIK